MERDLLLIALVQEVLGPRGGPDELFGQFEDPREEYLTGVLAPHHSTDIADDADTGLGGDEGGGDDDQGDGGADVLSPLGLGVDHVVCPALDPRARPASLGLSFAVACPSGTPTADLCFTWGRYSPEPGGGWRRRPRGHLWSAVPLDRDGTTAATSDAGIKLHVRVIPERGHWRVSVFLVNITPTPGESPLTEEHVFQPQIRVRCAAGTDLVPLDDGRSATTDEDKTLAMLYRSRPSFARGHLCAATWEEQDPERPHPTLSPLTSPPYCWSDGLAVFGPVVQGRFSPAQVRSEYVPTLPVNSPDKFWDPADPAPVLDPTALSEMWDGAALRAALAPFADAYESWIRLRDGEVAALPVIHQAVGRDSVHRCDRALARIRDGIDLLATDNDARLAFCFANRAISLQSQWVKGRVNPWFPFQLGFQLLNLAGVADRGHADREICDLLWFPTGGGKTEAYLGLAAFTMAYRRLKARRNGDRLGGAGVAILSRYTLRLLTIQQFRRALALVTACEFLRVQTSAGGAVGWRPKLCPDTADGLWGDVRFSAGLWVGGGVTPNSLHGFEYKNRGNELVKIPGAIDILEEQQGEGEPAQVLTCPACEAVLAIPPEGYQNGDSLTLHFVLGGVHAPVPPPAAFWDGPFQVNAAQVTPHPDRDYCTLTLDFSLTGDVLPSHVDQWWRNHVRGLLGQNVWFVAARPSRPGYFIRTASWASSEKAVDFEVFCPCPKCKLNTGVVWREKTAVGSWPVHPAFLASDGSSIRCPIPAWTVDDQVYHCCPTMVIATVDKFARLSFEPKAASLFGNVDHCNEFLGYYRRGCPPQAPVTSLSTTVRPLVAQGKNVPVARFAPPDLVLQDELHLIEGPLGSMVGMYETAIDLLAAAQEGGVRVRPKYIASTATVRQAAEQVQSLFARDLFVFPPNGLTADDNFFARLGSVHPRDAVHAGRLYAGVCAPGRGAQTPLRNIWARLLQHVSDRLLAGAPRPDLDPFWTLVGYFNAIRELSGAVALARQDIPQRLSDLSASPRRLNEGEPLELSSRADSMELPGMLDRLRHQLQGTREPVNAVVATSMFGTGVDVDRLGLMVVQGQPKTTSSYIQATGRVGRSRGGLVLAFLRASRPRDLNHYEFFTTYHSAIYRHVEPVTVNPFAPRARDRALGPVSVAILRQADAVIQAANAAAVHYRWRAQQRLAGGNWHCLASEMAASRSDPDVTAIPLAMEDRAQGQPASRRPAAGVTANDADAELDCWQQLASLVGAPLLYSESTLVNRPSRPVVLGDLAHLVAGTGQAFEDAPTSLREVESTVTFKGWQVPGMAHQQIRPSQFVITYGPGTILETRSGPVLMKSMDEMFRHINRDPQDFEIVDPRLSRTELNNARIARLPTNDELQLPIEDVIYPTDPFPYWALCTQHNPQILYLASKGCPQCPNMAPMARRQKAGREAIRFVMACEAGHLDEVDWHMVVHGPNGSCQSDYYRWYGGGRALRFVDLECPRFQSPRANMGQAYGRKWPCSCRSPESGPVRSGMRCTRSNGNGSQMVQRGAANLRMNVPVAALTIMDMPSRLHNILSDQRILTMANVLHSIGMLDQAQFFPALNAITPALPVATLALLNASSWSVLNQAIMQMLQLSSGGSRRTLLEEEFERLERAATQGAPPVPSAQPGGPPLFEVRKADVLIAPGPTGRLRFRVTPVSRLRMVYVQKAYQRMEPQTGDEVSTAFQWGNQTWYPGVALYGEGIFLDLENVPLTLTGPRVREWQRKYDAETPANLRLHPVHVWWHTLAHRLLQSLAVDSGYSSASIRERIYLHNDATHGIRGGLLLFTVQPGGDGTLGGLMSLVPRFAQVLDDALRDLATCSNDPLCEQAPQLGAEGAACYSCLLASETSCEHRNMGLDRLLLLDNLP